MRRYYKVSVEGDAASKMLETLGLPAQIVTHQVSVITVVVSTTGSISGREEAIDAQRTPTDEDEWAYLLDVMTLDEGTFPGIRAREVTKENWVQWP